MSVLWPIGTPLLYGVLLWRARHAIRLRTPTTLSRATMFLWDDYKTNSFWWEPLEMCRKLTLVGWVLPISEKSEEARIVVALLVSVALLALHFAIRPLKRCAAPNPNRAEAHHHRICLRRPPPCVCHRTSTHRQEDGALYMLIELALVLCYICVLLIKTCDPSLDQSILHDQLAERATCSVYGLGGSASGECPT
jgi:hypothetical protein